MSKAIRDIYGEALVQYGGENRRVVVLDADVSGSTKSGLFGKQFPDRFYNVGIAESNMVAMAAGMAAAGSIAFANTFAVFLTSLGLCATRSLISYSSLNVKLMGAYGGLSDSYDGPSHHSYEDIGIMRQLPNLRVYVPSDAQMTDFLVKHVIETEGPVYMRLSRNALPDLYDAGERFVSGKGKLVRDYGKDATLIACGCMVAEAVEAADRLKAEGIGVRVVDMFTIKPLDEELIKECARSTGAIVTAEEHNVIGGLASAVAETLTRYDCSVPLEAVGMQDRFAECGDYGALLDKYGLNAESVYQHCLKAVRRKKSKACAER